MSHVFDNRDVELLAERVRKRERLQGPRIGDFIKFADGVMHRISYDWDGGLQTCDKGSFYIDGSGHADFSGGHYPIIDLANIETTTELMDGDFWFFHHDIRGAHRGVYCKAPCRIFMCGLASNWWQATP